MARQPRFGLPGCPQHVIQRGNNRQAIFCDTHDYRHFLDCLAFSAVQHAVEIHAYVLMTNHVHLLLTPSSVNGVGKVMQSVGRKYVRYFNDCYRRTGSLYEGRYRATMIDSSHYLLACMRYIELNPCRAGMVQHPSEYSWSSYRRNGCGAEDALISPHGEYLMLGAEEDSRRSAYRALFESAVGHETMDEIRDATNMAWVLGDVRFCAAIETQIARRALPLPRGGDRRSRIKGV
jgi:putative transposase